MAYILTALNMHAHLQGDFETPVLHAVIRVKLNHHAVRRNHQGRATVGSRPAAFAWAGESLFVSPKARARLVFEDGDVVPRVLGGCVVAE